MADAARPIRVAGRQMPDVGAAATDLAETIRSSFRRVSPDDISTAVREGPVRAIRDIEPADVVRSASSAKDAVIDVVAAVAKEITRDPRVVAAAVARLPGQVADRLPAPVLERLPSTLAERVPAVRRRRQRQAAVRVVVVGLAIGAAVTVLAIVIGRRRARRRSQVAIEVAVTPGAGDAKRPADAPGTDGESAATAAPAEPARDQGETRTGADQAP
jgi:hypothetical protein